MEYSVNNYGVSSGVTEDGECCEDIRLDVRGHLKSWKDKKKQRRFNLQGAGVSLNVH